MAAAHREVEILTQPIAVSEEEARDQVAGRLLARLKRLVSDQEIVQTVIRYKPYYAFDAVLTKRVFAGEDIVHEGLIVVDALTGISRPLLNEQIELVERSVARSTLVSPDCGELEAHREAKSRRMQVEHRERGTIELADEPRLLYKPVWLVELATGDVQVVDATDGMVMGDLVLG